MTGTLRWIPAEENGPTMPFDQQHISAFAYVGDRRNDESAIVVRGLEEGTTESSVEAEWVDSYPQLTTSPGDVITLIGAQRPIATIAVTSIGETAASDASV
ncbi:MAG: hypothetical protein IPF42_02465 [Candidatus Microthrix sp.]|nr:hypothetical protein [Candidatus Microthrix sp.]